jgi:hypothetical protein
MTDERQGHVHLVDPDPADGPGRVTKAASYALLLGTYGGASIIGQADTDEQSHVVNATYQLLSISSLSMFSAA